MAFVLSLCFLAISVGVMAFVIDLGQISSFFLNTKFLLIQMYVKDNIK